MCSQFLFRSLQTVYATDCLQSCFGMRLHYVPVGHGSPICSKRSVPWNLGHIFLSFSRSITSCFLVFLRCITISLTTRGSDKPVCHKGAKEFYGYSRSIMIFIMFYYGLLHSDAVHFVLLWSTLDETKTPCNLWQFCSFCIRISPLKY